MSNKNISGHLYQKTMNQVLLKSIFKDHKFYYKKEGKGKEIIFLDIDFIDEISEYKELVYKIIKPRNYMFKFENLEYFNGWNNKVYIIG